MIQSAHICITLYARNQTSEQQKTDSHTYLMRYVNIKI